MKDNSRHDSCDITSPPETTATRTHTQVVSSIYGGEYFDRRRQSLRARLEREQFERQQKLDNFFSNTLRNLFQKN